MAGDNPDIWYLLANLCPHSRGALSGKEACGKDTKGGTAGKMKLWKRFFAAVGILSAAVVIGLLVFIIQGLEYESYRSGYLKKDIPLENACDSLAELREEAELVCASYIEDHSCVQIEGELGGSRENRPEYKRISFGFYRYVDDKAEGGRISVIFAEVDLENESADIYEFYGAGKAGPSIRGYWDITEDELEEIENGLLDWSKEHKEGSFRAWKNWEKELVLDIGESESDGA